MNSIYFDNLASIGQLKYTKTGEKKYNARVDYDLHPFLNELNNRNTIRILAT